MALTSRKKRPIDRQSKPAPHRDARLFIIATEGRKTEKQYFSMFGNKRCQVRVIPNEDNKSAPAHILKQLKNFKKEFQLNADDELWLMVDVDRWGDKNLASVSAQAGHNKFQPAVSNPCFEVANPSTLYDPNYQLFKTIMHILQTTTFISTINRPTGFVPCLK